MTTPAGVPNLPIGALTVETLGQRLQDQSATAMRNRAGEQMPAIFGASTGGNILSDLSPFGILTKIWAEINSRIATADPVDIQGPEDIPPLLLDFIESLPVVGQFVQLLEALAGTYDGEDPTLLAIQDLLEPIRLIVGTIGQGVADFLNWLWNGVSGGFAGFGATVESSLKPILEWLNWLWELFGSSVESVLNPIFEFLHWVFTGLATGAPPPTTGNAIADALLQPVFSLIKSVWDLFSNAATGIGETASTLLHDLFDFINWLWNGVAGGFAGFGDTVNSVLKPALEFLGWLFSGVFTDAAAALRNIFTALQGLLDGDETIDKWIAQIPLVGPLVGYLTANIPDFTFTPDLAGLGQWADRLLHLGSDLPAGNLIGQLSEAVFGTIPVSHINISSANLLGQGAFATAGTIDAANGWEWDGTTNDPTGTSSGSAKLTTAGSDRYLYSRQAIKVAAGDKIKLSARIKTASYTGGANSIVLSLIPYAGTSAQTEKVVFSRGASNGAWVTMTGVASDVNPYIVPAGVTSLIVKVGVAADSGTGSTLWVDNVDMRKEGLLGQNLVEYLINAWGNLWQGLVGTSGAGKTWADMLNAADALRTFAGLTDTNLSGLQGDLLSAPAEVLGSLFSVVFDGTKTVADFLKALYNALNGSTSTTPKTVDDVTTAAAAQNQRITTANENADQAILDAQQAAQDAQDSFDATTNLRTALISGYTVVTATSTTTWTKPAGVTDLWVVLFGAGANGSTGPGVISFTPTAAVAASGGTPGAVIATQINPTIAALNSPITVTIGTTASPTTSFGSIVTTALAYAAYVATPLGLLPSASAPTAGGNGGGYVNGVLTNATPAAATTAGVSGGIAGTNSVSQASTTGGAGGGGTVGLNFGLCQTGGSGGGGGGWARVEFSGAAVGGSGGNGAFPGGGGGGGGAALHINPNSGTKSATGGAGGAGANGMALIIYKTANTVV